MMTGKMNYRKAGVDIKAGDEAVERIKGLARSTFRPEVLQDLGGFGGLFAPDLKGISDPVLVAGSDGVGTKLRIAFAANRHDTIGIDCVAMCVNDLLVQGAEPLFFLDYLAVGKLEPAQVEEIIKGVAEGCRQAGCALLGGETAEMPGFYPRGEYDLAGFAVGMVDRPKIVDGSAIREGDQIIGLASSGLHSNGYSLARRVLLEDANLELTDFMNALDLPLAEELLKPTTIYVRTVLELLRKVRINGMAHITGGGLVGNIPRILPKNLSVEIKSESWPLPPIFKLIADLGAVDRGEMYRVFNMGIGYVLVIPEEDRDQAVNHFAGSGQQAFLIGKVISGDNRVVII
jgi:phosphoribosylformylglycinamidine cyclo-ligase